MLALMEDATQQRPPFAPPFLRVGQLLVAQTALCLQYLGPRLGLVPRAEASRLWAHQLQLTIADFVTEIHDAHHPIGSGLYYHAQKPEAMRRSRDFIGARLPKFLGWFERVLARNHTASGYLLGRRLSYVDLSMYQIIDGLRYAFPRAMAEIEPGIPRLCALHARVAQRPNIAAY